MDDWQGYGQYLPNVIEPGNIDLMNRPMVQNPDSSISTLRSMSFGQGPNTVLLPTVHQQGYNMSPEEAWAHYLATRQHLGIFKSPDIADTYARHLSQRQSDLYLRPTGMSYY